MNNVPWGLIRSFLAVAEFGSLSAAAREMGTSQPTLSRDIQALEASTALQLFQRSPQGLRLTEAGQRLVESAQNMQQSASHFERQAEGLSTTLEGDIRVSVSEIVGLYFLPEAIAAFVHEHPKVHVEIVITNQASSLNKREADIALRMFCPTQPDLVARRLPDMKIGFFAHESYIQSKGEPASFAEWGNHQMIGFDAGMEFILGAKDMGINLSRKDFQFRTDSLIMQLQLARAGCGIVGTHVALIKHMPELKQVLKSVSLPPLEFWIVCHTDTQYNARIRALRQHLIDWFSQGTYHS